MDTITFDEPVNIHDAKTHFSKIIAAVEKGQTVTISRYGKPVATLGPIAKPTSKRKRQLGVGRKRGNIELSWEEFEQLSKELDAEILKDFEESISKPL